MAVDPGSLLVKAALMAVSMALSASRKIEGPRLESRDVAVAEYGTPLPRLWGSGVLPFHYIWAKELREVRRERKTKGGKFESYEYYFTGAGQPCDNPLQAIPKLWMDNKLVVQRTAVGPVSMLGALRTEDGEVRIGGVLAVYLGTQTEPDPTYEDWCEERYGAGSATAFKTWPYIVIKDMPVEVFGNRPPQIKGLCLAASSPNYLVEAKDTSVRVIEGLAYSSDFSRFIVHDNDATEFEVWDTASRTIIASGDFPVDVYAVDIADDGTIWGVKDGLGGGTLHSFSPDGFGSFGNGIAIPEASATPFCLDDQVYITPFGNINDWIMQLVGDEVIATAADFSPGCYIKDTDGNHWAVGRDHGTSTIGILCVHGDRAGEGGTFTSPSGSTASALAVHNGTEFVIGQGSNLCRVTVSGATITVVDSANVGASPSPYEWLAVRPGSTSMWADNKEIDLTDLSVIRTIDLSDWGIASFEHTVYDPISDALLVEKTGESTKRYHVYLDRVTEGATTLAAVTTDVCNLRSVTDIDVSDLTSIPINGWFANMGSGSEHLQPLFDIHDVDPVPHDFGLLFRVRGDAATDIIQSSELVGGGDVRWEAPILQDRDLPYSMSVTYADSTNDHETNTAYISRFGDTTVSEADKAIDMKTYLSDPTEAQPFLERLFRRTWGEREKPAFSVKLREARLEPGDVLEIELDGVTGRYGRATRIVRAGITLETEWVRDDPRFHDPNSSVGPSLDARDEDELFYPSPSKAFVLDIPYTRDSENAVNPALRFAAGAYIAANWPGAAIWQVEDEEYDVWNTVPVESQATWGYAEGALAEPATPWLWDRGSTLDVTVYAGKTLTSSTEAAINADPTVNQAVLQSGDDWEIVNFVDVTLLGTVNGNNRYRLSTFKRGRRGTEWACDGHAAGDAFLLTSSLQSEGMGLDDIGVDLEMRGESIGRSPLGSPEIGPVFAANDLKPYAPIIWHVVKETNGDLTIEIRTRTRIGGAWNGTTIPTGETIAEYEFDVYDGATFKRTLESTDKTFTYTAAQQTTDHGADILPDDLEGFAYQLSATVSRGFARAA